MAEELTGDALKERARELDIEGRSDMSADELRKAVAKAEKKEGSSGSSSSSGAQNAEEDQARANSGADDRPAEEVAAEYTDPRIHDPNYFGPSGGATGEVAGAPVHPDAGDGIPQDQARVTDRDGNPIGTQE